MATTPYISKIVPGGGINDNTDGTQFENLDTWETWASADNKSKGIAYHAECYVGDGTTLGVLSLTLSDWSSPLELGDAVKIYAANGEHHGGSLSAGAHITAPSSAAITAHFTDADKNHKIILDGLRISYATNSNGVSIAQTLGLPDIDIRNCLFMPSHDGKGTVSILRIAHVLNGADETGTIDIINNIFYDNSTGASGGGTFLDMQSTANQQNYIMTINIYNNTFVGRGNANGVATGIFIQDETAGDGTYTNTYNIKNNVVVGCPTNNYNFDFDAAGLTVIKNISNNVSEDATADDEGGSGHIINASTSGMFLDLNADWTPAVGSSLISAGTDLFDINEIDLLGNVRPQGALWDIGAIERLPGSAITSKTGRLGTNNVSLVDAGDGQFVFQSVYHTGTVTSSTTKCVIGGMPLTIVENGDNYLLRVIREPSPDVDSESGSHIDGLVLQTRIKDDTRMPTVRQVAGSTTASAEAMIGGVALALNNENVLILSWESNVTPEETAEFMWGNVLMTAKRVGSDWFLVVAEDTVANIFR